jgi:hypothetical protein
MKEIQVKSEYVEDTCISHQNLAFSKELLHASVVQLIMDEDKEDNYCPH